MPETRVQKALLGPNRALFGILLQFVKIWHQQKRLVFFFDYGPLQDPCAPLPFGTGGGQLHPSGGRYTGWQESRPGQALPKC